MFGFGGWKEAFQDGGREGIVPVVSVFTRVMVLWIMLKKFSLRNNQAFLYIGIPGIYRTLGVGTVT